MIVIQEKSKSQSPIQIYCMSIVYWFVFHSAPVGKQRIEEARNRPNFRWPSHGGFVCENHRGALTESMFQMGCTPGAVLQMKGTQTYVEYYPNMVVMWGKQCHVYHSRLGMVNIPPIKMVMTGGWFVVDLPTLHPVVICMVHILEGPIRKHMIKPIHHRFIQGLTRKASFGMAKRCHREVSPFCHHETACAQSG